MCHVLVIEDDFLISKDLAEITVEAGATSVDIAVSPAEAIASALACPPAVLFSDIRIIDGTGPEAVSAIREQLGPIPVIFITGTPDGCHDLEAHAVLLKPFAKYRLIELFRSAVQI